ncbi:MAG: hypothetical protein CM1200mP2_48770 [Planctomycetaceae bacterium]|nr:MAG: hypothetical protein CM1200mP2_48770 [Planctomycetaceae bacterium]
MYGTVLYIPEEKNLQDVVLAGPVFPTRLRSARWETGGSQFPDAAYAESRDGLNWTLPDLGLVSFNGSRHNNLCRFSGKTPRGSEWFTIRMTRIRQTVQGILLGALGPQPTQDPRGCRDQCDVGQLLGRRQELDQSPGQPGHSAGQRYRPPGLVGSVPKGLRGLRTVPGAGGRKIARSESRDFINWSPSQLVFAADAADTKSRGGRPQFYGMGTTIYEGTYIGLPWLFWENSSNRLDVQLASSRDGIHWQRAGNRQTLIPNGKRGTWDGGCIFTASQPLQVKDDTIYIYYSGLSLDHEEPRPSRRARPEYGESSIGVATLRRDGFVSMRAGEKPATLVTGLFQWPAGRRLHLNVDAPKGGVRVGVLDQNGRLLGGFARSKLISGDRTDVVVEWAGSGEPKAKSVQLKFEMTNADLYSYWLK